MSALTQIVNVVITQQTQAVPQASFSIPLIVGPTGFGNSDVIRLYSSAAAMLSDGFTTSSPEYIYAVEATEQALVPAQFYVGKRTTAVAQQDTIQVLTLVTSHLYSFTLNGAVISYTSGGGDTQQAILTALNAAISAAYPTNNPVSGVVTGTGAGATLTLTSTTPGLGVSYSAVDSDLAHSNTIANNGIQDDLQKILNAPNGNLWYGLVICSNVAYDILQAASFIESQLKIFIGASSDSAVDSGSTTDVASVLKGKAYKRTALVFSPLSANLGIDAAWMGGQLPQTPGTSTWKFKTAVGISPDTYTDAQHATLIGIPGVSRGKGVNIYETVGGVNIFEEGWMVGGQFIDVTIGIDNLQSLLVTQIFGTLVNSPKVPYTDKGIAVIENDVRSVLASVSDAGGTGFLDATSIVVSVIPVSQIPANTRAQRILPGNAVTFSARMTGAFHFINVNGIITV